MWNSLGPLSVDTILDNSNLDDLAIDPKDIEFKKWDGNYFQTGFHKKGTNDTRHGICRFEVKDDYIYECMYVNDKANGFGRVINPNGNYYIGMFKNDRKHG